MLTIVLTPMAADAGQATPRDSAESRIQHPFGVLNPGCSTVSNFRVLMANWGLTSAPCEFKGKKCLSGTRLAVGRHAT